MTELTEAQKIVLEHAKSDYDRKLKTWSIDRALEIMKTQNYKESVSAELMIKMADILCAYVLKTPKEWPVLTEEEAEAHLSQLRATGEI